MNDLLRNIDKIHTTELGIVRINRNLGLSGVDTVKFCKDSILSSNDIERKGKNWYVIFDGNSFTVNAHSYTIITAHKIK